jgi:hypothetical protein
MLMPPVFIIALGGVIVVVLVILALDLVTRPLRRRKIEARRAHQRTVEERPIPGLAAVASQLGWQGPLSDPTLIPGLPFGGTLPPGLPFAGLRQGDQVKVDADPVSLAGYAGNLARNLHWVRDPDRHVRNLTAMVAPDTSIFFGPAECPGQPPRLLHCYRVNVDGTEFVVGNCYLSLGIGTASGYHGPIPDARYLASAFCAASLRDAIAGFIQVVPRPRTLGSGPPGTKSGFPELDQHYVVLSSLVTTKSRSKLVRRLQFELPEQPDPLGPQLAVFIAQRDDWAFSLDRGLLVCSTFEPLRSGDEAQRLVTDTVRAVGLVGC